MPRAFPARRAAAVWAKSVACAGRGDPARYWRRTASVPGCAAAPRAPEIRHHAGHPRAAAAPPARARPWSCAASACRHLASAAPADGGPVPGRAAGRAGHGRPESDRCIGMVSRRGKAHLVPARPVENGAGRRTGEGAAAAGAARSVYVVWARARAGRYTRLVRNNDFRVKGRRRLDRMVAAAGERRQKK